jgi:hypothetical protein
MTVITMMTLFERKVQTVTEGLAPEYSKHLCDKVSRGNALTIANFQKKVRLLMVFRSG